MWIFAATFRQNKSSAGGRQAACKPSPNNYGSLKREMPKSQQLGSIFHAFISNRFALTLYASTIEKPRKMEKKCSESQLFSLPFSCHFVSHCSAMSTTGQRQNVNRCLRISRYR